MKNIAPMLLKVIICIAIATNPNYPLNAQGPGKGQGNSKNTAAAQKEKSATVKKPGSRTTTQKNTSTSVKSGQRASDQQKKTGAKPKSKATAKASAKTGAKKANSASKKNKTPKSPPPPPLIQHILKTNPMSWFALTANAAYEKVLTRNVTVQLGGSYTYQSGEVFDGLTAKLNGYSVTPEIRYYLTPFSRMVAATLKSKNPAAHISAPLSVYIGGWGKMANYKAFVEFPDHPDQKAEIFRRKAYSGGVSFGSQFWLKYRKKPIVLCDLSLGGGWVESKSEMKLADGGKLVKMKRSGFVPNLSFHLGLPLNHKF